VQCCIIADIVIINRLAVLELLSAEDDSLLFRWDALLYDTRKNERNE